MNTEPQIIEATTEDAPEIAVLHKAVVSTTNANFYSPEVIEEWLSQISPENILDQMENSEWIVVRVSGRLVAFAQYSLEDAEIYQINVLSEYCGRGIGSELLEYIETQLGNTDVDEVTLNSTLNAVGFYKHKGYEEVEPIKFRLDETSVDMVYMKKTLIG